MVVHIADRVIDPQCGCDCLRVLERRASATHTSFHRVS